MNRSPRVARKSPALVGDFNSPETPTGMPATRPHGALRIIGLTKPVNGDHYLVFQIGDRKRVQIPMSELTTTVNRTRIFDRSTRDVGGEILNGTDVVDLYQWAMQSFGGSKPLVCLHHQDAPLGADGACPACINEQTSEDV